MPIYEYRCGSCAHVFEKLMRLGAEAPPCPECDHAEVEKLVSASGFILKGTGWYKDHYGLRPSSDPSDSKAEKDSGSSPASSPETKKDTSNPTGGDA
jgi:putative FmdB family regulatory protein